jgi:CheY-like chemotaxis protein/HPt (histidine-containing phosphotransfer) domain-containing protein
VLAAEDNEVNRQFVRSVLEKRGHEVVTARNGQVALDILADPGAGPFDLVLMDVQMPELDGLSASVILRQRERAGGLHVPIVAMTAHAMSGDRERCLAAGMDDYVSKPLHPHELVQAVERNADSRAPLRTAKPRRAARGDIVFDPARTERRLGGERKLLREIVTIFRAEAPAMMERIASAAASGDSEALRRAAHALKGSLGTLDAPRAFQAAAHLDAVAGADDRERILAAVTDLTTEMAALRKALLPRRRAPRKVATHAPHKSPRHPRRR